MEICTKHSNNKIVGITHYPLENIFATGSKDLDTFYGNHTDIIASKREATSWIEGRKWCATDEKSRYKTG